MNNRAAAYTVYKHTAPNGKTYIGLTGCKDPNKRWRNGKHYEANPHFTNAIELYGWENIAHEIIATGLSKEAAVALEIELIAQYKSNIPEYGYNQTEGGDGCDGFKVSEETRRKISVALTGEKHPLHGKHPTAETRQKQSIAKMGDKNPKAWQGKERSPDTRQKISE